MSLRSVIIIGGSGGILQPRKQKKKEECIKRLGNLEDQGPGSKVSRKINQLIAKLLVKVPLQRKGHIVSSANGFAHEDSWCASAILNLSIELQIPALLTHRHRYQRRTTQGTL